MSTAGSFVGCGDRPVQFDPSLQPSASLSLPFQSHTTVSRVDVDSALRSVITWGRTGRSQSSTGGGTKWLSTAVCRPIRHSRARWNPKLPSGLNYRWPGGLDWLSDLFDIYQGGSIPPHLAQSASYYHLIRPATLNYAGVNWCEVWSRPFHLCSVLLSALSCPEPFSLGAERYAAVLPLPQRLTHSPAGPLPSRGEAARLHPLSTSRWQSNFFAGGVERRGTVRPLLPSAYHQSGQVPLG